MTAVFCIVVVALILGTAWLGRRPKRPSILGTGRDPRPEEIIKDPDFRPSKIKGQWGGPFG